MQDRTNATLRDLLAMDDEVGVITVSIGFAPSSYADGPTGPDEVRAQLRKLGADREEREAIAKRVDDLSDEIDQLLDPRGEGRGRYLAATVTGDTVIQHRLQVDLPAMAAFDDGPVLRHLLEALDEHEPAAALLLHANEATLLEVGYAGNEELETFATRVGEIVLGDENTGPGASGPASGPGSSVAPGGVTHRDQQQDRVRENQDRFLRSITDDVRSTVEQRGIKRLVLVGPAHERNLVRDAFGTGNGVRVLDVDRVASGDLRDTIEAVQATLSEEHASYERELVSTARDRAHAGGQGALGAAEVTDALIEGRVEHLLLSPELELRGWSTDDVLVLDAEDPRAEGATEEPRFVHRMIERAMATDATVTPVDGEAAEVLDELGGVAALLRW